MHRIVLASTLAALLLGTASAFAAQRTFVRSDGNDGNPCTLQLPCRGFAAAIAVTNPNGELVVLDSAGYGFVTITQAVSIVAPPGVYAGISVFAGQDGVTVNAGAGDDVVLRGLTINGQGGDRGIVVTAARRVRVEQCDVANMASEGIKLDGGSVTHVVRSTVRSNGSNGIRASAPGSAVLIEDSRLADNTLRGLLAEKGTVSVNRSAIENNGSAGIEALSLSTVRVAVRDSMIVGNFSDGISASVAIGGFSASVSVEGTAAIRNGSAGFVASTSVGTVDLVVSHSAATDNSTGIYALGAGTTVSVSASTLSRNVIGLQQTGGASLRSHGNNAVNANGGGDTSGTITPVGLI